MTLTLTPTPNQIAKETKIFSPANLRAAQVSHLPLPLPLPLPTYRTCPSTRTLTLTFTLTLNPKP